MAAILFGFAIGLPLGFAYIDSVGGLENPQEAIALSFDIIERLGVWAFAIDALILGGIGYYVLNRRKEQSDPEADE